MPLVLFGKTPADCGDSRGFYFFGGLTYKLLGGGIAMKPYPNVCRMEAARCVELASHAKSEDMKQLYLKMSEQWDALAKAIERPANDDTR